MTGIAGYVGRTKRSMPAILDRMAQSMRYTESALVDRWTSDLVGVCRVHHGITNPDPQPIFNEDRSIFLLMDGEIFGYEKKSGATHDRLTVGSKKNDAEYCLQLYEKLGDQAFIELNGSFSLAIYESGSNELLLVTDRFSSRPIFYSITEEGTLFFGSKLSSVLESPEVRRELELTALFEFFTFQKIFGTRTPYRDIAVMPAATVMRYHDGRVSFDRYWKLRYKNVRRSDDYYAEKLAEAIKKALERRTREKPGRYGILLSGGLDSRMVLAAADQKMVAFTTSEFQNREVRLARTIAQTKGCSHLFLSRSPDHYVDILDKAAELSDGLCGFDHAHFIGLFDEIRNECDILFHGCYLDAFKALYLPRRALKVFGREIGFRMLKMRTSFLIEPYMARLSDEEFVQQILSDPHQGKHILDLNPMQVFAPIYSGQIIEHLRSSLKEILSEARQSASLPSDMWDYIIDWHLLPKQRTFLHLNHIRAFMPERSVIFDNDLFDLYTEMPPDLRRDGKVYRKALKKLDPRIADIPDANTGFSPQIRGSLQSILRILKIFKSNVLPSKSVFTEHSWPNFAELLRQNQKMRMVMEDTIRDPACLDPTIFDRDRIVQMLKEHVERKSNYAVLLLLLLTFGRWHKKFGPRSCCDERRERDDQAQPFTSGTERKYVGTNWDQLSEED